MSLTNRGSRCGVFGLLAIYLGCVLLLSGDDGRPFLGQVPGTLDPAIAATYPASAHLSRIPDPAPLTTPPSTAEILREQFSAQLEILYKQPGTIIAHGQALQLTSYHSLKAYTIEQVDLSAFAMRPVPASGNPIHTENVPVKRFWRVRVSAEPGSFPMTSLFYTIWANDTLLGQSDGGSDELVAVVFDSRLLPEGASIGVSLGMIKPYEVTAEPIHYTQQP
ncbi:MAG: hypothetical protein M3Z04_10350 [Chloroflexota bacterium]|nr:hypothetical protein [Chloroflexota bacterium]